MVHSDAIWVDVLDVGTAEKTFENKNAELCILTQLWELDHEYINSLIKYLLMPDIYIFIAFFEFKSELIYWHSIKMFTRTSKRACHATRLLSMYQIKHYFIS